MSTQKSRGFGGFIHITLILTLGTYFTFAAVQGDFGLFQRIQIEAEIATLEAERDMFAAEVALMQNKTRRLSDAYLDLDLLDARARDVLGYVRTDEIVIH